MSRNPNSSSSRVSSLSSSTIFSASFCSFSSFFCFCFPNNWTIYVQLIEHQLSFLFFVVQTIEQHNLFSFIFVVQTIERLLFNWLNITICFHLFSLFKQLNNCWSIDWTSRFVFTLILSFEQLNDHYSIDWTTLFCFWLISLCKRLNDCCSINWTTHFIFYLDFVVQTFEWLSFNRLNITF